MKEDKDDKEDKEEPGIADIQWQRTVKVLELLARHRRVKDIASQFNQHEKWVRDQRNKALGFSPSLVATLPLEVQDYLIRERERRGLKTEPEEFRRGQANFGVGQGVSAVELARAKHWEELATLAGQLVTLREEYNIGHPVGGYDGYIIDDPLIIELPSGLLNDLLIHLKHEFPEFSNISNWRELLKIDTPDELIVKLALVAYRRMFKGTCPFFKD